MNISRNSYGILYCYPARWQRPSPHALLSTSTQKVAAGKGLQRIARLLTVISTCFLFTACSVTKQITTKAQQLLLKDSAISTGHIGISIYEPATNRYWYNYEAGKYFVPASNTKLFSLYAGLTYLGDSLPGIRYQFINDSSILVQPTGDPTLLHADYVNQPVYRFLQRFQQITLTNAQFTDNFMGRGWAWDDYTEPYMAPRSNLPLYGNLVQVKQTSMGISVMPRIQQFYIPGDANLENGFNVDKKWEGNLLTITGGNNRQLAIPFTPHAEDVVLMLQDTLQRQVLTENTARPKLTNVLRSQPVDSLFIPMMHRSDNFFAEQTLLMASNEILGYMNDRKMIDTLLKTHLKNLPQQPKWVDGSGLSRYNLFTPQSFVYLLNKMKNEFGLDRLKTILPTGGEGTLSAYYKKDAGFIFAKTGTLSNHCALSGFIITKKNKLLIFSVLANHYQTSATPVRRAVERFLTGLREKY